MKKKNEQKSVVINGITFTPKPGLVYKHDYVDGGNIIENPDRWHEAVPAEYLDKKKHPEVNKAWVEQYIWRNLIRTDLWFVVYFVLGVPDEIANTKFVLERKCRMVEDGPKTNTLDVWSRSHAKSSTLTKAETIQYHLRNPDHCVVRHNHSTERRTKPNDIRPPLRHDRSLKLQRPMYPFVHPKESA